MSDKYARYLESEHWLRLRDVKLDAASWLCERCGEGAKRRGDARIGLAVHHLTYERLGREDLSDLIVLCHHCHEVVHGLAPDTERNRIKIRRRLAVGVVEWNLDEAPELSTLEDHLANVHDVPRRGEQR